MNRFIQRIKSGMSLFWRYFFLLALMVGLFLIALTTSSQKSAKALQDAYLDQTYDAFQLNCDRFSDELLNTTSLISSVEASEYYSEVNAAFLPLTTMDSYYFLATHQAFRTQCSLLTLSQESFLYFDRSQVCLSRRQIYLNGEDAFAPYRSESPDGTSLYDTVVTLAKRNISTYSFVLMPVSTAHSEEDSGTSYLALLVPSMFRDQVYIFFYQKETILDSFLLSSLPEGTCFQLLDSNNATVLLSHNDMELDYDDYIHLSSQLPGLSCTAVLHIPQSYFLETIQDAQNTTHLIFLLCVVLGLLACILFSHISVRPFRMLIQNHSDSNPGPDTPANEFVVIDRFLHSARERNAALGSTLLSSILVRIYSGQLPSDQECQTLSSAFPLLQQPMRAAIIRDGRPDPISKESSSVIQTLQNMLPDPIVCECINLQESLLLFPDEPENFELLQFAMQDMNMAFQEHPMFVCGVSSPFTGLNELARAIRQARFSLPEDGEGITVLLSERVDTPPESDNSEALRQFQQALSSWDRQKVQQMLDSFARAADRSAADRPEELFYSLLYLLRDAAHSAGLVFDPPEGTAYQHTNSPAANIRVLSASAENLFDQRADLQTGSRQQLREQIVQYIRDNYSDTNMSLYSVAQSFCVSVRFVQNVIQSVTGMNFINFLTGIRIEHAARLLLESDAPITVVADQCGYPALSTFYRNFKKYHHVTPVEYREKESSRS